MGYQHSDDRNFSRQSSAHEVDHRQFGERSASLGRNEDEYRGRPAEEYGHRSEDRNDRSNGFEQERYGHYGMSRSNDSYRGGYTSVPSYPGGGRSYGSRQNQGDVQNFDQQNNEWPGRYERQGFPDRERGHGIYGNAEGSQRYASQGQQPRGHHDPDYQQWRDEQLRMLDADYESWRKDRYQKFSNDFSQWRSSRTSGTSGEQPSQQNQKGDSAGNTTSGTSSATQGNTGKSKESN